MTLVGSNIRQQWRLMELDSEVWERRDGVMVCFKRRTGLKQMKNKNQEATHQPRFTH